MADTPAAFVAEPLGGRWRVRHVDTGAQWLFLNQAAADQAAAAANVDPTAMRDHTNI